MELPAAKAGKKTRVTMAVDAMATVDAMKGTYRCTTKPHQKRAWLEETWENPQLLAWCGHTEPPNIQYGHSSGTYHFSRNTTKNGLNYSFGLQPMTDTDLALSFAYSARFIGWPAGSRLASGLVHDPHMLMLTVAGLWVHSPGRAKELYDMYGALKLNVAAPIGGWDPGSWGTI